MYLKTCTAEVSSKAALLEELLLAKEAIDMRERPARTPPSTFLFLPIHFSNIPGPFEPVPGKFRSRRSRTSDMATGHGRMVHRVNSEGLRRRAIAQAAARQDGLYSLRPRTLSTVWRRKYRPV